FDNLGTVALSLAGRSRDTESREKVGESNCELLRHRGARHHSRSGRRPVSVTGHVALYESSAPAFIPGKDEARNGLGICPVPAPAKEFDCLPVVDRDQGARAVAGNTGVIPGRLDQRGNTLCFAVGHAEGNAGIPVAPVAFSDVQAHHSGEVFVHLDVPGDRDRLGDEVASLQLTGLDVAFRGHDRVVVCDLSRNDSECLQLVNRLGPPVQDLNFLNTLVTGVNLIANLQLLDGDLALRSTNQSSSHETPRSTIHPEPAGNGVGVVSATFWVLANGLLSKANNICCGTRSPTDLLVFLLLKEGKHLGDDDRGHQVIRNVGKRSLAKPVLQTVRQPVQRRGGEGHEPIGQLTLSLPNELVDLTEDTALCVTHRRRVAGSGGLLAKLLHLVDSLRIGGESLLHTQSSTLASKGVHAMNELRADSLRPLRTHDGLAAREANRTTGTRNSVHVPAGSVPRHNAALCEPL